MDIEKLIEAVRLCGSTPKVDQCKQCAYWSGGDMSQCIPRMTADCATAITDLLVENQSLRNAANRFKARAGAAEARAEKAERERNEAVRICAKLIALCSLFQRKINRTGDYMGCGYTFLDGFNLIIENFVETADDELYTVIRDATEKEIIERSMRMSGTKEE